MVEHQTYLIILLPAEGLDPLRCNDCQRGKQEQQQQQSLPVLMKKIEHVIPVQTPGGIIQNHCLSAGIRQQGDAPVQPFDHRLTPGVSSVPARKSIENTV